MTDDIYLSALVRLASPAGKLTTAAMRVAELTADGTIVVVNHAGDTFDVEPESVELLPYSYTHEVWVNDPISGRWEFEYGGTAEACVRYLGMAVQTGARIWEFSIRPLAFAMWERR